jgi:hypothetical protein
LRQKTLFENPEIKAVAISMFTKNLFLKLIIKEFDCRVANPSQEEKRKAQRISLMMILSMDRVDAVSHSFQYRCALQKNC